MTTPIRTGFALLFVAAGLSSPAAELVTLGGKQAAGTLVQVDGQFVTFKEAATGLDARTPIKEVDSVDLRHAVVGPARGEKYDEAELTDGSVVRLSGVRVRGKKVEATLLPGPASVPPPTADLPLGTLFWVLRGADDAKARDDWKRLLAGRGKRDLFVVRQAEGLNALPGTVIEGNPAGDRLTFEREDGQRSSLPLARSTGGLVFNQPPRDVIPPTVCKVVDVFGNVWFATGVEVVGAGLRVRTVSGAAVEYPSLDGVSKLDFSQGNVAYLSDLDAVAAYPPAEKDGPLGEQFPFAQPFQKDRGLDGSDIVFGGRKFAKGVSVPADATLTYRLDGGFREFKATAGVLDVGTPADSALRLRIEVDGRPVFAEAVAKKMPPREINLNVKDAKELRITVERDALFAGNQINLGDARVQK